MVAYGAAVHWALDAADAGADGDVEVIDLRTLCRGTSETVLASVRRTGRALVVHEAPRTGGFGAEVAATIAEECFDVLDAPVIRVAALDTPVPATAELEAEYSGRGRLDRRVAATARPTDPGACRSAPSASGRSSRRTRS